MEEHELYPLVRQIIREEFQQMTMAKVGEITNTFRATLQSRYSEESGLKNLRTLHTYGVSSKPPEGTEVGVLPVGGDPTHLNVIGSHDDKRPTVDQGEMAIYNAIAGQLIRLMNDGTIRQGSPGASEPVVLGNVLKALFSAIFDAILNASQIGIDSFGLPVFLDPGVRAALVAAKSQFITTAATNILGQKNFVERTP